MEDGQRKLLLLQFKQQASRWSAQTFVVAIQSSKLLLSQFKQQASPLWRPFEWRLCHKCAPFWCPRK